MIDTEQLVTSPVGFGLTTATPVQRAACRVRDGLPLGELASDADVQSAFGGIEALSQLPGEHGSKPVEFFNVASARTFKTGMACASAIVDTQTVDVSGLGHGEIARISIVSLKLDVADVPYRRTLETLRASPVLAPLLVDATADTLTIRHPSGKLIEVCVVAGSRAASGLVARWCAGAIFDEAPRMTGREDGVVNLADALSAVRERLLPGAQIQCIGSPWAPSGPVYDVVQSYFGKPTDDIVVMRTTGPAGNPSYWTPERLERLQLKDEVAWRINALGEFIAPESGLLSPVSIRQNTRETPLEVAPEDGGLYGAAIDVGRGRWTLVITEVFTAEDNLTSFRVVLAREVVSLSPDAAWREIAETCGPYGVKAASVDQYAAPESASIAARHGLRLLEVPWTPALRLEAFSDLATLAHSDRIEFAPDRLMQRDMRAVRKRATQNGYTIVLPQTSDGRHCDFAPALAASLRASRYALIPDFDYAARSDEISRQIYGDSAGERSSRFWGAGGDDVGGSSLQMNLDEREAMQQLARKYSR